MYTWEIDWRGGPGIGGSLWLKVQIICLKIFHISHTCIQTLYVCVFYCVFKSTFHFHTLYNIFKILMEGKVLKAYIFSLVLQYEFPKSQMI